MNVEISNTVSAATSQASIGRLERVKNILLAPSEEWARSATEPASIGQLCTLYVIPLSAFAAGMSFVHTSIIGVRLAFGGWLRTPAITGLVHAVMSLGIGVLGVFMVGFIINALAPRFCGQRDQRQAFKAAAYSLTPALLSPALALLPAFATVLTLLAGCYGIYILSRSLPVLMHAPRERAAGYTVLVVSCTILLGILLGIFAAATGMLGVRPH